LEVIRAGNRRRWAKVDPRDHPRRSIKHLLVGVFVAFLPTIQSVVTMLPCFARMFLSFVACFMMRCRSMMVFGGFMMPFGRVHVMF
jgi:hypothetical protein